MFETEVIVTSLPDGQPEIVSVRPILRGSQTEEEDDDQLIYILLLQSLSICSCQCCTVIYS